MAHELREGGAVDGGQGDAGGGSVDALHVLVRPEEAHLASRVFVGFHAFEAGEGVMQDGGGGVEAEVLVWGYAGCQPALGCGPFDGEHVVLEGGLAGREFWGDRIWRGERGQACL